MLGYDVFDTGKAFSTFFHIEKININGDFEFAYYEGVLFISILKFVSYA
jgi:hypothetical protein